jgi:hypothetical protein
MLRVICAWVAVWIDYCAMRIEAKSWQDCRRNKLSRNLITLRRYWGQRIASDWSLNLNFSSLCRASSNSSKFYVILPRTAYSLLSASDPETCSCTVLRTLLAAHKYCERIDTFVTHTDYIVTTQRNFIFDGNDDDSRSASRNACGVIGVNAGYGNVIARSVDRRSWRSWI